MSDKQTEQQQADAKRAQQQQAKANQQAQDEADEREKARAEEKQKAEEVAADHAAQAAREKIEGGSDLTGPEIRALNDSDLNAVTRDVQAELDKATEELEAAREKWTKAANRLTPYRTAVEARKALRDTPEGAVPNAPLSGGVQHVG